MNAGRLARKAADKIRKYGWTRGVHQDKKGQLCLRGAFALAYNGNPETWSNDQSLGGACKIFARWLFPDGVDSYCGLVAVHEGHAHTWNDGMVTIGAKFPPPESAEEVVAILEKFADELDPQR